MKSIRFIARRKPTHDQSGQSLPLVLIAMGVGILLVSVLLYAVDSRLFMSRSLLGRVEERYTAEAGVEYALWQLTTDTDFRRLLGDYAAPVDVILPDDVNDLAPDVTVQLITSTIQSINNWGFQNVLSNKNLRGVFFVGNNGWVVGDQGELFRTTTGGLYWSRPPGGSGTTSNLNAVFFADANNGWAVGDSGTIIRSTNGGLLWSTQNSGTGRRLNGVFFWDASDGWAVGDKGVILYTHNEGAAWTAWTAQTSGSTKKLNDVTFVSATRGWAVGDNGTILYTNNGGTTWTAQSSGVSQKLNSVSFVDANHGWAVGEQGKILKTGDGVTWQTQSSASSAALASVSFVNPTQGWAAGDGGVVQKTTNGGSNWQIETTDTTNRLRSVFMINATTGWMVGDRGSLLYYDTSQSPANWNLFNVQTTQNLNAVAALDASSAWTVGNKPGTGSTIMATMDGSFWQLQPLPTINKSFFGVIAAGDDLTSSVRWAVGENGNLINSINGGTAWASQDSKVTVNLRDVFTLEDPAHPGTFEAWAVGDNNTLSITTDGTHWNDRSSNLVQLNKNLYGVFFTDIVTGWVVGQSGTVQRTANGGSSWITQTVGVGSNDLYDVWFTDNLWGWAVGQNGTIISTTNAGVTWTPQTSPVSNHLRGVSFVDTNTGWAVGDAGAVHYTNNGGAIWNQLSAGTTVNLRGVYFADVCHGWVVGDKGMIVGQYCISNAGIYDIISQVGNTTIVVRVSAGPGQATILSWQIR